MIVESGSLSVIKGRPRPYEFEFIEYLRERGYLETKLWEWKSEDNSKSETLVLYFLPEKIMEWYPSD